MKGRLVDLSFDVNHKQRITLVLDEDFTEQYDLLKDTTLEVDIKKYRETRSLNANAYFHVLVHKIAEAMGSSNDKEKTRLVVEYGSLLKDESGKVVGFTLPSTADVSIIYPYVRLYEQREKHGKLFNCYLAYKQTHMMDSKEMARLIDGAIAEAKELGLSTDTPEQIAKLKAMWAEERS